ncbi:MAG: hypothetical protein K2H26_06800, partial [Ruminococcus sp.]|nr:hypothetical protein [Ruminococcus sp.]
EKDQAHDVIHIDHDSCLNSVPEPRTAEIIKAEMNWKSRLEYLPDALVLLKDKFPLEYNLIHDYFLSDSKLSMSALAEKYNISFKTVEYRLTKAKELLKKYIILHENNN